MGVLIRERAARLGTETQRTHRERSLGTGAEVQAMCPQAKECQGLGAAPRSEGEVWSEFFPPEPPEGTNPNNILALDSLLQKSEKTNFCFEATEFVVSRYTALRNEYVPLT